MRDGPGRRRLEARDAEDAMTACIVGWAHTPFGKHDAETVESLVQRVDRALYKAKEGGRNMVCRA